MVSGSSGCWMKNSTPAIPIAKAIGIPITNSTAKAMTTINMAVRVGSQDIGRAIFGALAVEFAANLERGRHQQQCRPHRQAHGYPGIADFRNTLEAAHPADPR